MRRRSKELKHLDELNIQIIREIYRTGPRNISEIAESENLDPFDFVFDLIVEEYASASVILFSMSEDDVRKVLESPFSMVGSDSSARATYGVLSSGKPHPRAYGTFPRVLGKYVREEKVLTLSWQCL